MRFFLILLVLLKGYNVFSQEPGKQKNNIEILKDMLKNISDNLQLEKIDKQTSYKFACSGNDNNWIIENLFVEFFSKSGFNLITQGDSTNMIEINHENEFRYNKIKGNDEIISREFHLGVIIKLKNNEKIIARNFSRDYSDTISSNSIEKVGHNRIIVKSEISESAFDSIIKPIIIIGGFGLLIYSFFSIRNN